jgi:hypothetical protein
MISQLILALAAAMQTQTPPPAQTTPAPVQTPSPRAGDGLGYVTGNDLYARCTDSAPGSISYCFAYIAAVHDTMRAYEIWLNMREFCVAPGTSQGDLKTAFISYARVHPIDLNGQAASVVVNALKASYSCPVLPAPVATPTPAPTPTPTPVKPRRR